MSSIPLKHTYKERASEASSLLVILYHCMYMYVYIVCIYCHYTNPTFVTELVLEFTFLCIAIVGCYTRDAIVTVSNGTSSRLYEVQQWLGRVRCYPRMPCRGR